MRITTSRRLLTSTLAVLVALMAAEVFAATPKKPKKIQAPEIDLNAGAKGLAVLVTGFLLVGEHLRRRRS